MPMEMTRERLKQYKSLLKEIESLDRDIDKLRDRTLNIPTVFGKVTASSHDFPYIPTRLTVQMDDPREADMITRRIRIKEKRKSEAARLALEIEQFIAGISDSTDRQIFERAFLNGQKQIDISEAVHLEQSTISKRIKAVLQDSYNS